MKDKQIYSHKVQKNMNLRAQNFCEPETTQRCKHKTPKTMNLRPEKFSEFKTTTSFMNTTPNF